MADISQASERSARMALVRQCIRAKAQLRADRTATMDDVYEFFDDLRCDLTEMGRALSTTFSVHGWVWTGRMVTGRHHAAKGRKLRVWRLEGRRSAR